MSLQAGDNIDLKVGFIEGKNSLEHCENPQANDSNIMPKYQMI